SENVPLSIAFGNGQFVAVGGSDATWPPLGQGTIQTSVDGVNWIQREPRTPRPLPGVAFGNGHFVAVTSGGEILQSGSIVNLSITSNFSTGFLLLSSEGPTGLDYTIQSSADLVIWRDVTKISNAQSSKVILDGLSAASDRQFYRAISQ